ncbi:hypothetical protein K437DRAFT_297001, partial [Tilletiaria anomala UBC 951]
MICELLTMPQLHVRRRIPSPIHLSPFSAGPSTNFDIPETVRTFAYILALALLVILQVPTALVNNVTGFMILWFLERLMCSPPLATGGASIWEVFSEENPSALIGCLKMELAEELTLLDAHSQPEATLRNLSKGSKAGAELSDTSPSSFTFIILNFLIPETLASNMLSRRTRGPRKGTGRPHLRTKGELIAEGLTDRSAALMGFLGPFCI